MPDTTLADQYDDHPTNKLAAGTTAAGLIGAVVIALSSLLGPAMEEILSTVPLGPMTKALITGIVMSVVGYFAMKYGGQRAAYNVRDKPNRPINLP